MQPSPSSSSVNGAQSSNHAKSPDYVYFDRTTAGFSDDAVPRAKAAQLKLEHYYKVAVDAAIERNQRCAGIRSSDRAQMYRPPVLFAGAWSSRGSSLAMQPRLTSASRGSCSS